MPRVFVGIAIGADSIAATWRTRGRAVEWTAPFARDRREAPSVDVLRSALADMRALLPTDARVTLAVALLPPLVRLRRIELPRMNDEDRRLAVSRAAERHFVGLANPVCAVERRKSSGSIVPFLAAASSSAFISDLEQVAAECGWVIDRFVPAHVAWLVSAKKQCRELRGGDGRVIVEDKAETTVLVVRRGALEVIRRFRSSEVSQHKKADSRSITFGELGRSAALVAADAAQFTRSLQLLSNSTRQARFKARARVTRRLLGVAASCVICAAGVYRWGLSRQLAIIAEQRSTLRARVNAAVAARETLAYITRSVNAIQSLERQAPRWSVTVARIAVALPRDAALIALRADADSVSLEGQAGNAAAVFNALRSVPGVVDIRSTAPIRQELMVGEKSLERWALEFRVDRK